MIDFVACNANKRCSAAYTRMGDSKRKHVSSSFLAAEREERDSDNLSDFDSRLPRRFLS